MRRQAIARLSLSDTEAAPATPHHPQPITATAQFRSYLALQSLFSAYMLRHLMAVSDGIG